MARNGTNRRVARSVVQAFSHELNETICSEGLIRVHQGVMPSGNNERIATIYLMRLSTFDRGRNVSLHTQALMSRLR